MIEFRYSRHRALGDFKRTWRDGKTTCGATSAKCQGILAPLGRGGMSILLLFASASTAAYSNFIVWSDLIGSSGYLGNYLFR